jgi:hypothetical protein
MQRILDSSELIAHWRQCRTKFRRPHSRRQIEGWAQALIRLHQTNAIVTPVQVEFLSGFTNRDEMQAAQVFLDCFACIDEGEIPAKDWEETLRRCKRIPRDGKPRQLGDCLIRAIAARLNYEVQTLDAGFPK